MNYDLILKLLNYFSRFVPLGVLQEIFIQPPESRRAGYDMIAADLLAAASTVRIPEIDKFIISINENLVSERIRNANGFILFVEYGKLDADFTVPQGIEHSIAVSVIHPFSDANNDNLNEILLMNRCLDLLMQILMQMAADQTDLDFCPDGELLSQPVEINVVDPVSGFGCGGWCATFQNTSTILL